MSGWCCEHHLTTGTCKVCHPETGTVDPQEPVGTTRIEELERRLIDSRARAVSAWAIVCVTRAMMISDSRDSISMLSRMIARHQESWPEDKL